MELGVGRETIPFAGGEDPVMIHPRAAEEKRLFLRRALDVEINRTLYRSDLGL
jgi:hypothetical protein